MFDCKYKHILFWILHVQTIIQNTNKLYTSSIFKMREETMSSTRNKIQNVRGEGPIFPEIVSHQAYYQKVFQSLLYEILYESRILSGFYMIMAYFIINTRR